MQKQIKNENANLPLIRTAYDGLQKAYSDLTALDFTGEISLTKQADLASCDINNIMAQYEKTGMLQHVNKYEGQYADLGNMASYHDAMNTVVEAQTAFSSLNAEIRARFGNDPGAFLDFVNNPENLEEMEKMGLVTITKPLNKPAKGSVGVEAIDPDEPIKSTSGPKSAKKPSSKSE